jgi:hypothetical protein
MVVDRNDAAKTQESGKTQEPTAKARLEQEPVDVRRRGRDRPFRLGKRTYPVWTLAMVEAREEGA